MWFAMEFDDTRREHAEPQKVTPTPQDTEEYSCQAEACSAQPWMLSTSSSSAEAPCHALPRARGRSWLCEALRPSALERRPHHSANCFTRRCESVAGRLHSPEAARTRARSTYREETSGAAGAPAPADSSSGCSTANHPPERLPDYGLDPGQPPPSAYSGSAAGELKRALRFARRSPQNGEAGLCTPTTPVVRGPAFRPKALPTGLADPSGRPRTIPNGEPGSEPSTRNEIARAGRPCDSAFP